MTRYLQVGICVFVLTYFVLLLNLPPLWSAAGYTLMAGVTYHSAVSVIQKGVLRRVQLKQPSFLYFLPQHGRFSTLFLLVFLLLGTDRTTY